MKMQYPYIEILNILNNYPTGLSTGGILKAAHKTKQLQAGSELKDTSQVSKLIHTLRGKEMITSSQSVAGNVHKITQLGIDTLRENQPQAYATIVIPEEPEPTPAAEPEPDTPAVLAVHTPQWAAAEPEPDTPDIADQLIAQAIAEANDINSLVTQICQKIDAMKNNKKRTIIDIDVKIELLETLAAMHNQEIAKVLVCIISDLSEI